MLELVIKDREYFDEAKQEFVTIKGDTLSLEHSLISISKWESTWCKPFLGKDEKTTEETLDYIRCMTIGRISNPNIFMQLTSDDIHTIRNYINAPMTATWFSPNSQYVQPSRETVTSELIYYWMIVHGIPAEYEKWHLNRLLTLIRVCNVKSQKPKPMSKRERAAQQHALNAQRRQRLGTKG